MLEKPDIPDELILARLQEEYDLGVDQIAFLPLGADLGTAVYRVITDDGTPYFLKLRKGFDEIAVTVPLFLQSQGIREIIAPIATRSNRFWLAFGEYTMILYPYIEGQDGYEIELSEQHRLALGTVLKRIHTLQLPPELRERIPEENFSPHWRDQLKSLQAQAELKVFEEVTAAKLADFMRSKWNVIYQLVDRAEELASELRSASLEFVLCHTDIHAGNLLIPTDGQQTILYIVDWDNPLLAPKERDLMFIGAGIDHLWKSIRQQGGFYGGYGKVDRNLTALAYYRYERVIEDLAVIAGQLLLTNEGGADRERSFGWFMSNFEHRGTIYQARLTDLLGRIRY